ncbi:MAG TPA: glycosyltransferase [Candidatus Acidoferrum sp.]|nr:glycosyltransferase [Candidatus Acidoferrum sp.]
MLPSRVAVVGNYLPRKCGIATFTTDLCDAIRAEFGATELLALPVNDIEEGYSYPARVRFELCEANLASYRQAADFLNFSNIDLVCLQHEYGIFGGPAGAYILELLRRLQMPVVSTLHTVLREPNSEQRIVMEEIAHLSDRLIVMSRQSAEILQEVFHVPLEKIDLIPHGIPDLPFADPNFYKDGFGTEGKDIVLTFGPLSPNKGVENVIQALPSILSRHSNVVYMIAGATHPHILRGEGDKYRLYLQKVWHVDSASARCTRVQSSPCIAGPPDSRPCPSPVRSHASSDSSASTWPWRKISIRLVVHTATPVPKKSASSVHTAHASPSAVANTGQSSSSRPSNAAALRFRKGHRIRDQRFQ